ncbi:MAG: DUF4864 domain-containing protein [Roseinatronobacter sp.]
MQRLFAGLLVCLLLPFTAQAEEDAIKRVITQQLDAFLADDFETAFTYASPGIKRLFGSVQRFEQMVRDSYPMVHRPAEVTLLDQRSQSGRTEQRVMIRDQLGRLHMLSYQMVETPEGWQINGVALLRAPEVGV